MGWFQFTRWVPDDETLIVAGVQIPSSIIESWQRWFEIKGIRTRIEHKGGGRVLYRWMNDKEHTATVVKSGVNGQRD